MSKDLIPPDELKAIKENCVFWSNNCGGCETCNQIFGGKQPLYDFQETYYLVCMIEDRDKKIKELEEKLENIKNSDTIKLTLDERE